ncbi:MAG: FkbM family methyltransferase [Chloroflexi bacterium]|nr:FkbM family methyltransferase [Chloroflexota bacterium]
MLTLFWLRLKKLSNILRDPFLTSALIKGAAAGTEHTEVLQSLVCECIVDVGANRGQSALIARKVFPNALIHSFEPLEEPARVFRTIFGNDSKVKLYPYAIGREKTTATLHVTKDDDSSSILPVSQTQSAIFPGAAEVEAREVTVLPLSEALDAVSLPAASLLKIDVQGFELEVLQGSEDILDKFSHLYIECSFVELYKGQALAHEIIAWLAQRGFVLSGIHNLYYEHGRAIQGDFLFSKKEK